MFIFLKPEIWSKPSFRKGSSEVSDPFILALNYFLQDKIVMDVSLAFSGDLPSKKIRLRFFFFFWGEELLYTG